MLVFFVVIYFLYFLVVPFLVWACFIEFACGDLAINSFFSSLYLWLACEREGLRTSCIIRWSSGGPTSFH